MAIKIKVIHWGLDYATIQIGVGKMAEEFEVNLKLANKIEKENKKK